MIPLCALLLLISDPVEMLTHHGKPVGTMVFSHDSTLLMTGATDEVVLLDTKKWEPVASVDTGLGRIGAAAFSNDDKLLATGGWKGVVKVWKIDREKGVLKKIREYSGHKDGLSVVLFSRDGKYLVTGDWLGRIRLWDLESPETAPEIVHGEKGIADMVWGPKGVLHVVDRTGLVKSYAVSRSGRLRAGRKLKLDTRGGRFFRFAPNGQTVLVGDGLNLAHFDLRRGRQIKKFAERSKSVTWAAFSGDGSTIACAVSATDFVVGALFSAKGGVKKETLMVPKSEKPGVKHARSEYGDMTSVAYSPDGRHVAIGCGKGQVLIFSGE